MFKMPVDEKGELFAFLDDMEQEKYQETYQKAFVPC